MLNRIILVTCGCKPFSDALAHSRRPETHNTATMKRRLSILFAMVAATVITALAHTSPVLGNVRNAVLGNGAVGIDYEYNLRGWTTNVTSNVFSQQIRHQDPTDGGTPRFNGNISAIVWDQAATGNAVARHGEYRYAYDGLDRLTAANYTGIDNRNHSCLYAYDRMGNATSIKRYGITDRIDAGGTTSCSYGVIDDVTLTYNGNRLVCADDAADALVYEGAMDFHDGANEQTEYAYDANGNLTKDLNRGIENISYDRNNMPTEITFASGARTCYTYDADGRKLRVSHYGRRGEKRDELDYIGDMVLHNGALERTLTPNGYIVNDTVYYYLKDYQGNVRNVVREDGAVVESNEYYPYGGLFSATPSVQPYKYGAKELDRTHGLDWYDSQARFYDSILLRTNSMDKKAGDYTWLSPYLWCAANPIKFVDPTGKQPVKYIDENGIKRIDWSIVVMVKALDSNANEKAIAKHEKYKKSICEGLENEFNLYLNGDGKGVENSEGDIVLSSFNIHIVDVDNTSNTKKADELSTQYKQEIKDNQPGKNGKAAVFMNGSTNGAFGLTQKATFITISYGAPNGTKSHELYHTTGAPDNGYDKGGILNSPPQIITPEEVDLMWNLIPEKK